MFATMFGALPAPTPTPGANVNGVLKTAGDALKTAGATVLHGLPDSSGFMGQLEAFGNRLGSDHGRLIVCFIVAIIVAGMLHDRWAALATFGSFWLTWYIYNIFSHNPQPLFTGKLASSSPKYLWEIAYTGGWGLIATAVGVAVGVGVFKGAKHHIIVKSFAAVGAWAGVMLVYSLVFIQFLGWVG